MSPEFTHDNADSQLESLKIEAIGRYGRDALFTYLSPRDNQLYTMTLDSAVAICGQYMAAEDPGAVWAKLDEYHGLALVVQDRDESRFFDSIARGQDYFSR